MFEPYYVAVFILGSNFTISLTLIDIWIMYLFTIVEKNDALFLKPGQLSIKFWQGRCHLKYTHLWSLRSSIQSKVWQIYSSRCIKVRFPVESTWHGGFGYGIQKIVFMIFLIIQRPLYPSTSHKAKAKQIRHFWKQTYTKLKFVYLEI